MVIWGWVIVGCGGGALQPTGTAELPGEAGKAVASAGASHSAPAASASPAGATPVSAPRRALTQLAEPQPRQTRELPRAIPTIRSITPPPRECRARPVALPSRRGRACDAPGGAMRSLAHAVELTDPSRRDDALAALESCRELPPGAIRGLRADLMRVCADTLVDPYLRAGSGPIDAELSDTLVALSISARWQRAASAPKPFAGLGKESEVLRHQAEVIVPWKERQLAPLAELEGAAASVEATSYAAFLIAAAKERALRRVMRLARSSPVRAEVKKDYEARTRYYAALDSSLSDVREQVAAAEARTLALVAALGIHRSADTDAHLLDTYGTRDDNFWGALLLEPPPTSPPTSDVERIVARIPAFYSELFFGEKAVTDARLLRLLIESGLPPRLRYALSRRALSDVEVEQLAYFYAVLAQRARQVQHWDEAIALLEPLAHRSPAAELVLSTARAARSGPLDPRTTERAASLDIRALQGLVESALPARIRAFALYNVARLRLLTKTPESVMEADRLIKEARALAPQDGTHPCLRPLQSEGPWFREPPLAPQPKPCDLPTLP
jgi:hypothetical protein